MFGLFIHDAIAPTPLPIYSIEILRHFLYNYPQPCTFYFILTIYI